MKWLMPASAPLSKTEPALTHCTRRAAELKGSIAMQEESKLAPEMSAAAKHVHEALAPYKFAEKYVTSKPQGYKEIIEAIRPE